MKVMPLARYLTDFTPDPGTPAQVPLAIGAVPEMRDFAAEKVDALRRARDEGRDVARAEFDGLQKQAVQDFESRLAAERQAWAAAEGAKLAGDLAQGLQRIEIDIAASVSRLLIPILTTDARQKTLDHLATELAQIRSERPGIMFHIAGPQDLIDRMRTALDEGAPVAFEPSLSAEIRVETDTVLIETCLAAWRAKLDEALR